MKEAGEYSWLCDDETITCVIIIVLGVVDFSLANSCRFYSLEAHFNWQRRSTNIDKAKQNIVCLWLVVVIVAKLTMICQLLCWLFLFVGERVKAQEKRNCVCVCVRARACVCMCVCVCGLPVLYSIVAGKKESGHVQYWGSFNEESHSA